MANVCINVTFPYKINYIVSVLHENVLGHYYKVYCKYLAEYLEVVKKRFVDCFFCQIFCTSENLKLKNYVFVISLYNFFYIQLS